MNRRYPELDALRGLAACVVVLRHSVNVIPDGYSPILKFILLRSPVRLLFAAHESVILFFLLSGFVLTLPFLRARQLYMPYLVKRTCRIYLPYLAALALAIVGAAFLHETIAALPGWFAITWSQPVSAGLVLKHVLFLGKYDAAQFNTAFWSLIYEMRVSLFFPLVYLLVRKCDQRWLVLIALGASLLACVARSSPYSAEYVITLHYAAIFGVGSLLAQHREVLSRKIASFGRFYRFSLAAVCAALFAYGQGTPSLVSRFRPLTDWPVVAGCSGLILLAITDAKFGAALRSAVPQFLGRISYSLYLVHGTVLFALVHFFYGRLPFPGILAIFLLFGFLFSWLFHHAIELPAMNAGRRAADLIVARRSPPAIAASATQPG